MKENWTPQLFSLAVHTEHAWWPNSITLLPMAFHLLKSLQMSATDLSGQLFLYYPFTTVKPYLIQYQTYTAYGFSSIVGQNEHLDD